MATDVVIGSRRIGLDEPTYFIADVAANHDGDLRRALDLMTLAKESGADCAKFQHFRAEHIVSDVGFRDLGGQWDHQATWQKSVYEVYADAALPWKWTEELAAHAQRIGIEFMSAPYDLEAVDHLNPYVNAFKIGSGDVTWLEEIAYIADKGKPVILATGASTLADVEAAMQVLESSQVPVILMQCNTNYTGSAENLSFVNLDVLRTYAEVFPGVVLGLSDHTPGHVTVLGAVSLGARAIEKHFTDDTKRSGPDHAFSMSPETWRDMVNATRALESALGDGIKKIEENETKTVILQRRCVRAAQPIRAGDVVTRADVALLRPAPLDAVPASAISDVVGKRATTDIGEGAAIRWQDLAGE